MFCFTWKHRVDRRSYLGSVDSSDHISTPIGIPFDFKAPIDPGRAALSQPGGLLRSQQHPPPAFRLILKLR